MIVLFKTITGSRLYGLGTPESDYDTYTVVDRVKKTKIKYATHTIDGNVDSVVVDFGTWINLCQSNVPQALEAMFSREADIDCIPEFREAFRGGTNYDKYIRTMKSFAMQEEFKPKRHALRLGINMRSLRAKGTFNPRLSDVEIATLNSLASGLTGEEVLASALAIAWS